MFGWRGLKREITVTERTVECPVKRCPEKVKRQRGRFKTSEEFLCQRHRIYISPTTFEYMDERDNLLWKSEADLELLEAVKRVKRESRMARDNSEDALTWNVFRYLERANQVASFLASIASCSLQNLEVICWSYSPETGGVFPELVRARQEFGETPQRSSEPDLIVVTDRALFWIDAKLSATNKTKPTDPRERKRYLIGGGSWYRQVFKSDYEDVAIISAKYELMRFWLLGSWMASNLGLDYYLVNLVCSDQEKDIESTFGRHINLAKDRHFQRCSWEHIYAYVCNSAPWTQDKRVFLSYFQNKVIGYGHRGELQRAFSA